MKKLALLILPLVMASCSMGSTQDTRPYTITLTDLGYQKPAAVIIVKNVTASLYSVAGAPDVRSIDFTATLYDSKGNPASYSNSVINPAKGTLFGTARGGYTCTTTLGAACGLASSDAVTTNTGPTQWPENTVNKAIIPFEWAASNYNAYDEKTGDTAGWYAKFTFTAAMANGKTSVWQQNYQFVSPTP